MPTAGAAVGQALADILSTRGIEFHPGKMTERINAAAREIVLTGGEHVGYDLLFGVPPHRPPAVVKSSRLVCDSGVIPVDASTLATGADAVYAIGDVTAIRVGGGKFLPKAASAEAEVVARRIAAELAMSSPGRVSTGTGPASSSWAMASPPMQGVTSSPRAVQG